MVAIVILTCKTKRTLWGMGGALVESTPLVRRVMGSTPALAATQGPWASPSLTIACGVNFRHSIHAVSGALLSSRELEEAL